MQPPHCHGRPIGRARVEFEAIPSIWVPRMRVLPGRRDPDEPYVTAPRSNSLARRLSAHLRREEGVALVLAIQLTFVLLVVIGVCIYYMTSNQDHAAYSRSNQVAFSLAEAGYNNAMSVLNNASNPKSSTILPPASSPATDSLTYPGGTIKWWGSYNSTTQTWTISGRGILPAPNSNANITRTVTQQVRIGANGANLPASASPAWGYIYVDNLGGGCLVLSNSVTMAEPLYISGNVCMDNTAWIKATASPLIVGGYISTQNSAKVGSATQPLPELHVGQGCRRVMGTIGFPCTGGAHNVFVTAQDRVVPNVQRPVLQLDGWYQNASIGPNQGCTTGSFPGGFDNDGIRNRSNPPVNMVGSTYDCKVIVNGQQVGRIAFDGSKMVIDGVVFIDGDVNFNLTKTITYTGRGSIYSSGKITLSKLNLCVTLSGDYCNFSTGSWDPEANLMVLVAGSTTDSTDFTLEQGVQFQGAVYAATQYQEFNSARMQGPIMAANLILENAAQVKSLPFNTLAPGMPGTDSAQTITVIPGTWNDS